MASKNNASQRLQDIAEDQAMSYPYPMASSSHAPPSLSTASNSTTSSRSTASRSTSSSRSSSSSHWTSSLEASPSFPPPCCYPILPSNSIFPIWDTVLDKILRTFDLRAWSSVGVYRIGWGTDMSPTVVVTVNTRRQDWHLEREGIKRILHQSDLPMVRVKFFEARNFSALSTSTVKASLGQSLAPHGFQHGAGTLGGYVETFDGETWHPFGITCSHVTFPEEVEETRIFRHHGLRAEDAAVLIDVPAVCDLNREIKDTEDSQKRLENNGGYLRAVELKTIGMLYGQAKAWYNTVSISIELLEAERKELSEYKKANSNIVGAVRYASGACRGIPSRTHGNGDLVVMDWALVEMKNDHVCSNRIPKRGKEVSRSTLHSEEPSPTLRQETEVFKVGRSTGHTAGKWSGVKHASIGRKVVNGKKVIEVTYERTVAGLRMDQPFSVPGDSGALVFTRDGQVVGMVVGGIEGCSISYVTPIDDLFADIKEWGHFHDIRVMQTGGVEEKGEEN